jgi:hypothetical protein
MGGGHPSSEWEFAVDEADLEGPSLHHLSWLLAAGGVIFTLAIICAAECYGTRDDDDEFDKLD